MRFNIDCRPADGAENCGTLAEHVYIDPLRSAIIIGEIEAHGPGAAAAADAIRARTRGLILQGDGVAATLGSIHEYFGSTLSNDEIPSARLFLGVVDTRFRRLHYGSAAFEGALFFGPSGRSEVLLPTGPAFGSKSFTYTASDVSIFGESVLVLATTGLTNALNEAAERFGTAGIAHAYRAARIGREDFARATYRAAIAYASEPLGDACVVVSFL